MLILPGDTRLSTDEACRMAHLLKGAADSLQDLQMGEDTTPTYVMSKCEPSQSGARTDLGMFPITCYMWSVVYFCNIMIPKWYGESTTERPSGQILLIQRPWPGTLGGLLWCGLPTWGARQAQAWLKFFSMRCVWFTVPGWRNSHGVSAMSPEVTQLPRSLSARRWSSQLQEDLWPTSWGAQNDVRWYADIFNI